MSYPYQGQQAAERVVWRPTRSTENSVAEWLSWLVAGTVAGIVPFREV